MNNVTAGIAGALALALVGGAAVVFATQIKDDETRVDCQQVKIETDKEWGPNAVIGTVVGGAAGGAIGHQVGGGSGKDVATAAGAVGGAYVGNRIAKENYPDKEVRYEERCREVSAG